MSGSTAWKGMAAKRSVVKLPHARAKQEECLIPNADARTQPHLPAAASEATLASFDPMGRRLAVVSREGAMYAVRVFDASTGALIAEFPGHASTVYDVQWAPERAGGAHAAGDNSLGTVDFAAPATRMLTASADGAARAWRVPAMGEDAGGEAAASAFDIVAQHACGCYSAAWHPTAPGVLATGARDGGVRLWATENAGAAAARATPGWSPPSRRRPASPPPPWPSTARACGCGWGSRTASCASTGWTSRAAARVRAPPCGRCASARTCWASRSPAYASRPPTGGCLCAPPPTASPPWT